MANFLLIIISMSAGLIISRLNILPKDSYKSINAWLLYVAMPALSLRFVPYIEWNTNLIVPLIGPVIVWGGAVLFVKIYTAFFKIDKATQTAMFITSALGNTGFIGFPLVSAYFGEDQLPNAIIFDQVTFILFSTLAVLVVLRASAPKEVKRLHLTVLLKLLRFPPFIACVAALTLPRFIDISPINPLLDKIAFTLSPLALFSIGLQLKFGDFKCESRNLSGVMIYKLMLAPLLVTLFALITGTGGNQTRIAIFQAAMPSHITASLMAAQYSMNPNLCTMMAGLSIAFSFVTTFFWWWITKMLF